MSGAGIVRPCRVRVACNCKRAFVTTLDDGLDFVRCPSCGAVAYIAADARAHWADPREYPDAEDIVTGEAERCQRVSEYRLNEPPPAALAEIPEEQRGEVLEEADQEYHMAIGRMVRRCRDRGIDMTADVLSEAEADGRRRREESVVRAIQERRPIALEELRAWSAASLKRLAEDDGTRPESAIEVYRMLATAIDQPHLFREYRRRNP